MHPRGHSQAQVPCPEDVPEYVAVFYHGLPVKLLSLSTLEFVAWEQKTSKSKTRPPKYIGLAAADGCTRIRVRPSQDSVFSGQLNLNDLLDAEITMLPTDAYALLLLVNHDLYEDDDDDFACGRAYGGSRVAVVSSARYNPVLDEVQSVERCHAWPASHCENYLSTSCVAANEDSGRGPTKRTKKTAGKKQEQTSPPAVKPSPLEAAISIHRTLPTANLSPSSLCTLWLSRVCRTASHELGHCFGVDHCMCYACAMQGTASISEDAAQPPYLCPVDLAKVICATSGDARRRYKALREFCERKEDRAGFFGPLAGWIRGVLDGVDVGDIVEMR